MYIQGMEYPRNNFIQTGKMTLVDYDIQTDTTYTQIYITLYVIYITRVYYI